MFWYLLKVCLGHEIDVDKLNRQVFGEIQKGFQVGNYEQVYLGYPYKPVLTNLR